MAVNDLISRKDAIDAVYKDFCYAYCDNCENDLDENLCGDCHRKYQNWKASKKSVEKTINRIQSKYGWVPCSERMPEKYIGEWLCCTKDGEIMILPYDTPGDGSKECVFYELDDDGYLYNTYDVVAWMPLPEPYKQSEPNG